MYDWCIFVHEPIRRTNMLSTALQSVMLTALRITTKGERIE
jgi:hypothetical protein